MKRIDLIAPLAILFLLTSALLPAAPVSADLPADLPTSFPQAGPPWYLRGDFNGWGTPGDLMYDDGTHGDDVAGDDIHTRILTITDTGRYEFKVDDGNWTDPYPPSNAWIETITDSQAVKFTFDTNVYDDGWVPSTLIVNAQDGVTEWTAVGDWQGWDNGNPATAMVPLGGGMYAYTTTIATAGFHEYKAVRTGTWDAVGPDGASGGRSINTANVGFNTYMDDQQVLFLADVGSGRITLRLQTPAIVINEFAAKGTEWIELYNPTTATVDLTGWYVSNWEDDEVITATILPDGYYSWDTSLGLSNTGDEIVLYDPYDTLVDEVAYGTHGGAPIEPYGDSVARSPNGYDSDDFARDWNLDPDPTRDAANDAAPIDLGSSLLINEMSNYSPPDNDAMELYNPTDSDIPLDSWWISDGDDWGQIITTSVVPAMGWLTFNPNDVGVSFSSSDVAYLFMPDGTRVDQIGWDGEYEDYTFQRICDGWGPNDGYDWDSSWGGLTWFDLPHTLGYTNSHSNCAPLDVDAAIAKDGPTAGVSPGDRITYTLSFSLTTIRPAGDLLITDTLPGEVTFYTFTSSLPVTWTGTVSPVVFQVPTLYGLQEERILLVADILTDVLPGTELVNAATISASGDMTLTNNVATLTTTLGGTELSLAKEGPDFALHGGPIAYTLTYEFAGEPAEGVVITDVLPLGVLSPTASPPPTQEIISGSQTILVWDMGTVSESGSIAIDAAVTGDRGVWSLHNQAWLFALTDTLHYASWDTELPLPIYEIQHVDEITGTSPSPYDGEILYVVGVVAGLYPSGYTLADFQAYGPWQGIYVYQPGHGVNEGELLLLHAEVDEYWGLTELKNVDMLQVLTDTYPVPAPILTTTAAISTVNPMTAEPLEGVVVEVHCAEVVAEMDDHGEWLIADDSGVSAMVDDLATYVYSPTLGDVLNVTGMLYYSFNDYKMEPHGDDDIVMIPGVVGTDPAAGATGVPLTATIQATFNISLSGATVNTATFLLEEEGTSQPLPGTVTYDPGSLTASFDPDNDLNYLHTYTATLTAEIESLGGAGMCADYTWSFTTEAPPAPDLGPSLKVSDRPVLQPGELFSYTIYLSNVGEIDADVSMTDILPLEIALVTETLPPDLVYTDGMLLWSGPVSAGVQVEFVFQAVASEGLADGDVFTNVVWIDDGVHPPFSREVDVLVFVPCEQVHDADFAWVPITPTVGEVVTFTAWASGTAPITYTWDFGDGSLPPVEAAGADITHTYTMPGTHTVVLTAANCGGTGIDTVSYVITVLPIEEEYAIYLPLIVRQYGP